MNDNKTPEVPYIVHEGIVARQERTIKRLWILCIIIFLALAASNLAWLHYESQFVDEEITVDQEAETGNNTFLNSKGNMDYGASEDYD